MSSGGIIQKPQIEIAGRIFTNLADLIVVSARLGTTANRFDSFRDPDGTAYGPSGVAFRVLASRSVAQSTANPFLLMYGDNNLDVWNGAAEPTTPVYEYTGGSTEYTYVAPNSTDSAGRTLDLLHNFVIPDGKFLYAKHGSTSAGIVMLFGYEE